jgi:uncharacterized protein (TIGR02597 family)
MIGGSATDKGRDTMIGLPRPVSITLDDLDFAPGQFVESATIAAGDRKDQLLVFDNAEALRNKQPDAVYFRSGGQWLSAESGSAAGSQPIEPSAGLLVRRAAGSGTTPILWVNSPTYDVTAP